MSPVHIHPLTTATIHAVLALDPGPRSPGITASAAVDAAAAVGLLIHGLDAASGQWWLIDLLIDVLVGRRGSARHALDQLVADLEPQHPRRQLSAQYHVR